MELAIYSAIALTTLIIGVIALVLAINSVIEVKAMQRSTHTMIQNFKPIDTDLFDEELEKSINSDLMKAEDKYLGLVEN